MMVIFVLAACAVFFLSVLLPPPFDFPWSKKKWQVVIGVIFLCGVLLIFLSLTMHLWGYRFLLIVQRLTGAEATQLLFGMVFGAILRYWGGQALLRYWEARILMRQALTTPAQGTTVEGQARGANPLTQPHVCLTIVLLGLLLVAAAAPYMGELFGGMTGLKTPLVELQFTPKRPEERPVLESERERLMIIGLTYVSTLHSATIPGDLLELEIRKAALGEVADQSAKDEQLKLKAIYEATDRFVEMVLLPIAECVRNAQSEQQDLESLRGAIRPVAEGLRRLIYASQPQDSVVMREAHDKFVATLAKSHQNAFELVNAPKGKCVRGFSWNQWPKNGMLYIPEMAEGPHIHLVLATFLRFSGDIEGEIVVLHSAAKRFGKHLAKGALFNINYWLSGLMYVAERDSECIFPYLDEALGIIQEMANQIDRQIARKDSRFDQKKLMDRKEAIEVARMIVKNAIAYLSAKAGERETEAILYAKENYEKLKEVRGLEMPTFMDTYGYVKMSFAVRKNPPDTNEVQQARALFQEAISHLKAQAISKARKEGTDVKTNGQFWRELHAFRDHLSEAELILRHRK